MVEKTGVAAEGLPNPKKPTQNPAFRMMGASLEHFS